MKLDVKVQSERTNIRTIQLSREQLFEVLCTALDLDKDATKFVAQGLSSVSLIETCNSTDELTDSVFVMRSRE